MESKSVETDWFHIDIDEYVETNRKLNYRGAEAVLLVMGAIVLGGIYAVVCTTGVLSWTSPVWLLILPALAIWIWLDVPRTSKKRILRFVNHPENARFKLLQRCRFDESGYELEVEDGTRSRIPWETVVKRKEGARTLALFNSQQSVHFVPYSAFQNELDRGQVLEWSRKHGQSM